MFAKVDVARLWVHPDDMMERTVTATCGYDSIMPASGLQDRLFMRTDLRPVLARATKSARMILAYEMGVWAGASKNAGSPAMRVLDFDASLYDGISIWPRHDRILNITQCGGMSRPVLVPPRIAPVLWDRIRKIHVTWVPDAAGVGEYALLAVDLVAGANNWFEDPHHLAPVYKTAVFQLNPPADWTGPVYVFSGPDEQWETQKLIALGNDVAWMLQFDASRSAYRILESSNTGGRVWYLPMPAPTLSYFQADIPFAQILQSVKAPPGLLFLQKKPDATINIGATSSRKSGLWQFQQRGQGFFLPHPMLGREGTLDTWPLKTGQGGMILLSGQPQVADLGVIMVHPPTSALHPINTTGNIVLGAGAPLLAAMDTSPLSTFFGALYLAGPMKLTHTRSVVVAAKSCRAADVFRDCTDSQLQPTCEVDSRALLTSCQLTAADLEGGYLMRSRDDGLTVDFYSRTQIDATAEQTVALSMVVNRAGQVAVLYDALTSWPSTNLSTRLAVFQPAMDGSMTLLRMIVLHSVGEPDLQKLPWLQGAGYGGPGAGYALVTATRKEDATFYVVYPRLYAPGTTSASLWTEEGGTEQQTIDMDARTAIEFIRVRGL